MLERHSLPELEKAAAALDAHIKGRRPKRSGFRRLLSLSIGVALTIFGAYLIVINLQAGRLLGLFAWFGVCMFVMGIMVIYSDFAEG